MSLRRTLRVTSTAGLLAAVSTSAALVLSGPAHATPDRPVPAAAEEKAAAAPLIYGEDISNHEPDHDWNASPAKFGIIKATEGLTFRDATFARNWKQLDEKGIVRGAYHFAHPANDPIAEAKHFLAVVNAQPSKQGDLLVLDLEATDGMSVAHVNKWAKTWLAYVKAKTGATPMVYSGWNFADTYGRGLAEYPLWVAHYSKAKGTVTPPADWKSWAIHQYTEDPIDENVSALSVDQLRALGRPAAKA
ncbi:glycoside hydrolase family 25 protein [Microtetraspora fusca]|uniref:glycoside hydrolase family 25 protein n=1 Tax=Microtetraspora fusca TaxID=1997 RepID=UPI0008350C78|nr:GH25 family lysozyme [Microtetraspora fusca]